MNLLSTIELYCASNCDWITVHGQHICVREGQSKSQAIKQHFTNLKKSTGNKEQEQDKWKRTSDFLDKLYAAKNQWNTPQVYRVVRKESEALVKSGKELKPKSSAQILLHELRENPTKYNGTLYRGMMVKPSDPILKLTSGKIFQVPALSSFSNSKGDAEEFAFTGMTAHMSHGVSVVMKVDGIKGIRIPNDLHEVITNGKFKVTDTVRKEVAGYGVIKKGKMVEGPKIPILYVTMKQMGVL
jgi:hypothetical protein